MPRHSNDNALKRSEKGLLPRRLELRVGPLVAGHPPPANVHPPHHATHVVLYHVMLSHKQRSLAGVLTNIPKPLAFWLCEHVQYSISLNSNEYYRNGLFFIFIQVW